MFNLWNYANARCAAVGTLEAVAPGEGAPRFVPLRRSLLEGEVAGPLADLRLTQVFRYHRDQCDRVLEAVYRFPLPGDAAITGVRVRFGDTVIATELRERAEAERAYRQARAQGRQATLLTREAPDVFTLHVTGIHPDQDVAVETRYVQLARPDGTGWSLRVPLTTAPRYVSPETRTSRRAGAQPLAALRDPGHRFALDLRVRGVAAVHSPTHALEAVPHAGGLRLRLREGEVVPDRDFVLTWRPARDATLPALQAFAHAEPGDPHLYFLALVSPPERPPARGVPREVILLVDRSGSMDGPKWEAAAWTARRFLSDLTEDDAFALCLFDHETLWLPGRPEPATPERLEEARRLLREEGPGGGTELGSALRQALRLPRADGARARHVLIVTDGQVADTEPILRAVEAAAAGPDPRRTSVICIDSSPNSYLVHELAERGQGMAAFLTSDPAEEDIATALDELLAAWEQPLWTGLALEVRGAGPRARLQAAGRPVRGGRIPLGDLPGRRALWVVGRCLPDAAGQARLRLVTPDGAALAEAVAAPGEGFALSGIRALFGARHLLALEHLLEGGYRAAAIRRRLVRLGYDPAEVGLPVVRGGTHGDAGCRASPDGDRAATGEPLRALLSRESLRFGVPCTETAFVAVREERGRRVEGTVPVGNALPAGWSDAFLASPPMPAPGVWFARAAAAPGVLYSLAAPPATDAAPAGTREQRLFEGTPRGQDGMAVLYAAPLDGFGGPALLTALRVHVTPPPLPGPGLDPDLELQLFAGDPVQPRARVRLVDLLRAGGERPLAVRVAPGEAVRLVLVGPEGSAWPRHLVVTVVCEG